MTDRQSKLIKLVNLHQKIEVSIRSMNAAALGLTSIGYDAKQKGSAPEKVLYGTYSAYSYQINSSLSANKQHAISHFRAKIASAITSSSP